MFPKAIKMIQQSFAVPFQYPVIFTRGIFCPENRQLVSVLDRLKEGRRHRVFIYLDEGLARCNKGLDRKVARYFTAHSSHLELVAPPRLLAGGEAAKSDARLLPSLLGELAEHRLSRHCFVMIIGGGAVLDVAGLAASLVHRGLRVVRIPTTALAQCDSGVGVKTSANWAGKKNLLGTFAPPFAVINDFDFLDTLPDGEWSAGIAESFKVALIRDAEFFEFLQKKAAALRARNRKVLERMMVRCAELHLEHIRSEGDPFEYGRARPLDFGHWSAHKLEALSGYRIGHGQAVAAGLALDCTYAALQGWITKKEWFTILRALGEAGLTLWYDELELRGPAGTLELFEGLEEFREHLGGGLCITFPRGIGRKKEVKTISLAGMRRALRLLKSSTRSGA